MASKKPPAPWFRQSLALQRDFERKAFAAKTDEGFRKWIGKANSEEVRRLSLKETIADNIKLLRKFAHGFEAKRGYRLADVASFPIARVKRLQKFAGYIRQEEAQPHVTKVASSPSMHRALKSHTGQRQIPGRFRYIVFTERPDLTKVSVVTPKKKKRKKKKKETRSREVIEQDEEYDEDLERQLPEDEREYKGRASRRSRVRLAQELPGGVKFEEQFFSVEDYNGGKEPGSFKEIRRALQRMLLDMPEGFYVLVTSNHGNISSPAEKGALLRKMDSSWLAYDKAPSGAGSIDNRGLATVVTGFKLISTTFEGAAKEYNQRLTRRGIVEAFREKQRLGAYRKRRARLMGKR
jgi:hypothetical protein